MKIIFVRTGDREYKLQVPPSWGGSAPGHTCLGVPVGRQARNSPTTLGLSPWEPSGRFGGSGPSSWPGFWRHPFLLEAPASRSPLPPQRLPIGELPPQRPPPQGPSSFLPSLTWGCVLTPCQSLLGGKLGCVGSQMTPVVGPDMIVARSDQPSPQSQCSQGGLPISGRGSQSRSRGWQPTELECEPWQPGSGLAPA